MCDLCKQWREQGLSIIHCRGCAPNIDAVVDAGLDPKTVTVLVSSRNIFYREGEAPK